ncbi:MAG TPA: aminotransferase class V-fold PLP-dependent enzyme, partial [Pirellulales bacterium]|nr:aminotransferase class V-fold PLP-dependent enzyme [Pirellulales bacterium]
PIGEFCRKHGKMFSVDAIQSLGVLPVDVKAMNIDFLSADGHKWLLGPEGAGVFYIRQEHLARLRPLGVGWNSVVHAGDFTNTELRIKDTAARYEGGSSNHGAFLGLGASVELLMSLGIGVIERQVLALADDACTRLEAIGAQVVSPRDAGHTSGIVSFELPGVDPVEVRRTCIDAHVVLSCRSGRLRISPHAYNNSDDLDRLIAALDAGRKRVG